MFAYDLRTEHMINPMGIDTQNLGLSWKCADGIRQTAYRIRAAASAADLQHDTLLWDSGETASDESLYIRYVPALDSCDRVFWQVRLKDEQQQWGDWSEPTVFETGLLRKEDMAAEWIDPEQSYDPSASPTECKPPCRLFSFTVPQTTQRY